MCLESGNGTLQKNAFRNRFTWLCYEVSSLTIFRVWVILCVPLEIWSKASGDVLIVSLFDYFTVLMLEVVLFWYIFRLKRITSKELDQFSREIIADAPGTDLKDWECVASHFNSYLYERTLWNTKYYMYNGADCYKAFRAHLLTPFALAEDNPKKLHALEESIPCGKEALEVYLKEIDKYWRALKSEKSSSALDLGNTKLPRDVCYCKLTWGSNFYMQNPRCIVLLLPHQFALYYTASFQSTYSRLACVVGSFILCAHVLYKCFQERVSYMRLENRIQFLSVIIKAQDSFSGDTWDAVAKEMNIYLFEQKVWRSDQFFFDGAECEQFFRRHFADVPVKKSSPTGDLNSELWPYIKEALAVCTCDLQV